MNLMEVEQRVTIQADFRNSLRIQSSKSILFIHETPAAE